MGGEEEPAEEDVETVAKGTEEQTKMEMAGTEHTTAADSTEATELAAVDTRYEDVPEQASLEVILREMKEAKSHEKDKEDEPPLN